MPTIDEQAIGWVARKFARGLSPADSATFSAWYAADIRHQGAYARAMALYNAIDLAAAQPSLEAKPTAAGTPWPPRRRWIAAALAAGLAATMGLATFAALDGEQLLATAKGELRKVPLQDKSIATINSGSRIAVQFSQQQRKIDLQQGEAWFEVAKDKTKPFIVASGQARILAVGTAFSVRRYAHGTEVLVTEGTVEVWNQGSTAQRRQLNVGERAYLASDGSPIALSKQPSEVSRRLAWREGKLVLQDQPLRDAVAEFNRYSAKPIVLANAALGNKRLFGQYKLDQPELFANDVSTVLAVPVTITADTIVIGRP